MNDRDRKTTLQKALRMNSDMSEAYAANPALRAVVVIAVPFVGGALDALIGTAGSNTALARLYAFLHKLRDRIAAVEAAKRDPNVTEDELIDAAIRAVRAAMETGDPTKVHTLASILVGPTSRERPHELDAESAVASLASLTRFSATIRPSQANPERPSRRPLLAQRASTTYCSACTNKACSPLSHRLARRQLTCW